MSNAKVNIATLESFWKVEGLCARLNYVGESLHEGKW